MDETANQMSDVREELADVMQRAYADATNGSPFSGAIKYPIADAILARFDVTEKPVVTVEELGRMTITAGNWPSLDFSCAAARERSREIAGMRLLDQLAEAGLTIVRSGEGAR